MSDSYLDHLPSYEREKIRKRLRSPEEYERLRECVRGPEDLEREMNGNAEFAEAKLHLESEPSVQESARESIAAFIDTQGLDAAFESLPTNAMEAMKNGQFEVIVTEVNHAPALAAKPRSHAGEDAGTTDAPMGNVAEVFPLKTALQQQVMASLKMV